MSKLQEIRFPPKWVKPEISLTPTPNTVATIMLPEQKAE